MIQTHLIKQKDFRDYVASVEVQKDKIFNASVSDVNFLNDFLNTTLKASIKLGSLCLDNPSAIGAKKMFIEGTLSYMIKHNIYHLDVFNSLYSPHSEDRDVKVDKLIQRWKSGVVRREQYLWAFKEMRLCDTFLRLLDRMGKGAIYDSEGNYSVKAVDVIAHACEMITLTEQFEGAVSTNNFSFRNMGIETRNQAKAVLEYKPRSDEQLKGFWCQNSERYLSNGDLVRLGNLICKAFKAEFPKEIKKFRNANRNERDRKDYTPKKEYTSVETVARVHERIGRGYSISRTAAELDVSESTVRRALKNKH